MLRVSPHEPRETNYKATNGAGRRINALGKVATALFLSQKRRKTEQQVMNVAGESA